ncbi:MAG: dephospho-CoA kinase [Acidimicrobiales bacterium]
MLAIGLTGGIGAGKSAVADLLVARGAILVDADVLARELVAPGGVAYAPLVDRFGPAVVAADGTIDRPALAALAFADPGALADLNAITHPAIGAAMLARRDALTRADAGAVAVFAVPLLTAAHRVTLGLDAVVVVDCPTGVAIERLVAHRGMAREDAAARVAAQLPRAARRALADFVVDNARTPRHLEREVDRLWEWLAARRR